MQEKMAVVMPTVGQTHKLLQEIEVTTVKYEEKREGIPVLAPDVMAQE